MAENMNCDRCKIDVNEVIILREHKFTPKAIPSERANLRRVCLSCAMDLVRLRKYNVGVYWENVFNYYSVRVK